jgi:hypothetical protein
MNDFPLFPLVLIIITSIIIGVIYSKKKSNSNDKESLAFTDINSTTSNSLDYENPQELKIIIPVEQVLSKTTIDDKRLFEITDSSIIARISDIIPAASEKIAKTIVNEAFKNTEIYQAIIPSGVTLANSLEIEGAVRGFYIGAKGIKGQANFVRFDPTKISKASTMVNGIANVINVGSLVVGQYYMSEINSKLETMSEDISKISDFQEREFISRILSVIARVGKISNFSSEILESDDLRNLKLQTLDDLEGECTQLLQQINLAIDELIKKNQKLNYKNYQEKVDNFMILVEHQQILISVLEEIGKLTYLLGKGEISIEMSYSIFTTYLEQSYKIRTVLEEWHRQQFESLHIDIDKNRIGKKGIEAYVALIPGFVNDKYKYKELENGLAGKIYAQKAGIQGMQVIPNAREDIYDKDVHIIIKDGKYFYFHEPSPM